MSPRPPLAPSPASLPSRTDRRARVGLARLLLALVVPLFVLLTACAESDSPLWADPGVARLDPDHPRVAVEIHNISATARPLGQFELRGADWGSFRFLDESFPRAIPAHSTIVLELEVSPASFRIDKGAYRSGAAELSVASDKHQLTVPLEFVGSAERGDPSPPAWLTLPALALLGFVAFAVHPRGAAGPRLLTRLGSASESTTAARLPVAAALASALAFVATIPFGPGLCTDQLAARVGDGALAECREGLGGHAATLLPASPGLWWWLLTLTAFVAALALVHAGERRRARAASSLMRPLGLALALAALLVGLAPASTAPVDLVLAQLRSVDLGGLSIPAWGLIAQPLACGALVLLFAATPSPAGSDASVVALERLERWVAAVVIVTLFLGGWAVPGLSGRAVPLLTHAGMIAVELTVFVAKIAVVELGLRRLGTLLAERGLDDAALLRAQARWALPLLGLNLLGVALWQLG